MDKIKAVECMVTWQGEVFPGKRVLLIRFKSCNRRCHYCDTQSKINNFVEGEYSLYEIQSLLTSKNLDLLITGGETTFGVNLDYTKKLLNKTTCGKKYVETNGYDLLTLYYSCCIHNTNVVYIYSPKVFCNNDKWIEVSKTKEFLKVIRDDELIIKIVYNEFSEPYVREIYNAIKDDKNIPKPNIYVIPEGKTGDKVLLSAKEAFKFADEYNLNISTRMHLVHEFY